MRRFDWLARAKRGRAFPFMDQPPQGILRLSSIFEMKSLKSPKKKKKQQINRDLLNSIIKIHSPEEISLYNTESFNFLAFETLFISCDFHHSFNGLKITDLKIKSKLVVEQ